MVLIGFNKLISFNYIIKNNNKLTKLKNNKTLASPDKSTKPYELDHANKIT